MFGMTWTFNLIKAAFCAVLTLFQVGRNLEIETEERKEADAIIFAKLDDNRFHADEGRIALWEHFDERFDGLVSVLLQRAPSGSQDTETRQTDQVPGS